MRGPCDECGGPGEELGTGSGIFVCPACFDELREQPPMSCQEDIGLAQPEFGVNAQDSRTPTEAA